MELLVRTTCIILVERWKLCDYIPNPYPKLPQSIAVRHKQFCTWNPQTYKKQQISIKTDVLSHNKQWKINIWGKTYIVISYELMSSEKHWKLVVLTRSHFVTQKLSISSLFYRVFGVIYNMLNYLMEILCYRTLPWTNPWKYVSDCFYHCGDVMIRAMASQITGVSIVYSTVCSGANQRKHKSSASLAFVRGNHWRPVNSPHKGP